MAFLKIGLLVLLILRVFQFGQRWRGGRGKLVDVEDGSARVLVIRGKHKEVHGVRVTLEVSDRFRFVLRSEGALDRFAKRFGIAQEWQTGDAPFDEKVFILSEDPMLLESLSGDRELRSLVSTILAFYVRARLECSRGQLIFDASLSDVDRKQSNEHLREKFAQEMYPHLNRLRDRLARISVGDWQTERDPALRRKAWLIGISTAVVALGIVGLLIGFAYERHQVVFEEIPRYSAWTTGGIGAAMIGAAFLWLGRSPHTHAVLLDVLLAAIPAAWMASTTAFTWYNEEHDASAPTRYVATVESMYTTKNKNTTNYHLVVASWPDVRGKRDVVVREDLYSRVHAGGCVVVRWHRGELGDGWVSGFEPADTSDCGSHTDDVEAQ